MMFFHDWFTNQENFENSLKKVLCTYLQLYFWKKVQEESSQKKLPKMTF